MALTKRKKILVEEEVKDLGLGAKDLSKGKRIVNKDGSFNFIKKGLKFGDWFNFYHYLVTVSWTKFIIIVFSGYVVLNLLFAAIYYLMGVENLDGLTARSELGKFSESFFFSAQSFTTVGYGRISPTGFAASTVAAFESLIGLLALALATGLLYGRFSRPVTKILYSENAVIAPFNKLRAFMFRIANKQKSQIVDVEVRVMFSILENSNGTSVRKFYNLELEYNTINFFPTVWTVNHPISESSPLNGLTEIDLKNSQAEFLVLLKGFDDTFSQIVHNRFSYRAEEIVWGAKFRNIFGMERDGMGTVELDRISEYERVKLD